ncbi:MAG TPA: hypothetical protein V6C63_15295 [Allocoleopsis sp.]
MPTPKGGRGKQAPYKTIQVRCPEPVKPLVAELIRQFHERGTANSVDNLNTSLEQSQVLELNQQIETLRARLEEVKAQRDELDKQVNRLTAQARDMDLMVQNQVLEIADLKKAIDSSALHNEVGNIDASTLFNQLRPLLSRLNDRERRVIQQKLEAVLVEK